VKSLVTALLLLAPPAFAADPTQATLVRQLAASLRADGQGCERLAGK
jgi:hypothetical protein